MGTAAARRRLAGMTADDKADLLRRFDLYTIDPDGGHLTLQDVAVLVEIVDSPLPEGVS